MLTNPVGPKDMALDLVGAGLGHAGSGPFKPIKEAFEKGENAKTGKDIVDTVKGGDSTGDKVMYIALDGLSEIPVAGQFVNTLAGMVFNIAVNNDVGRVTKIRSRAYIFFTAGYIQTLTTLNTADPKTNFDMKYFKLGTLIASLKSSPHNFQVQASLLHFASEHYTAGGWGGLSYIGHPPAAWTFPDQYILNWSPELMGAALATQLSTFKYLSE